MPTQHQMISEILHDLDVIRPIVLSNKKENANMRSLLRRMLSSLETLQNTPCIDPELYKHVSTMLTLLFDAEHGTLLKSLVHHDSPEHLLESFQSHSQTRKELIDTAQQDLPSALNMLRRGYDLLGKPYPEIEDLGANFQQFEKCLRDHLQGNRKVNIAFNSLTSAFKESMSAMDNALDEVGENSPELKQAQLVLDKTLPTDPEQAQALLRQAKESILKAGKQLNHAGQRVKQTMNAQMKKMEKLNKRLQHAEAQARNDPLTGLGNRRKLREFFTELSDDSTTFLMIDIDHFKHINDQYGHDSGDMVLERLGKMLKVAVRSTDMAARLGGEEFCIVLPETTLSQGEQLAEKIRIDIANETFQTQHRHIDVKVSIGVAERLPHELIAHWLKRADEALYQAKQGGRNQVVISQ